MEKPIPLFVLGCARSGTTSLANLVGSHPQVAGVQHDLHHGNIECPVCYHHRYWGEICRPDRYVQFLHGIACDDFFQVAGGNIQPLLASHPVDFFDFFLGLMDRHAIASQSRYWTVKFDMLFMSFPRERREFLNRIYRRYGRSAVFIGIERPWRPQLRSYLNMEGPHKRSRSSRLGSLAGTGLGLARYHDYNRQIRKMMGEQAGLHLQFDDFKNNPKAMNASIANYLDLDEDGFSPADRKPNTSFAGNPAIRNAKSSAIFAEILAPFMKIPFVAEGIVRGVEWSRRLPSPVSTRILENRYFPTELKERLGAEGSHTLLPNLNSDA